MFNDNDNSNSSSSSSSSSSSRSVACGKTSERETEGGQLHLLLVQLPFILVV